MNQRVSMPIHVRPPARPGTRTNGSRLEAAQPSEPNLERERLPLEAEPVRQSHVPAPEQPEAAVAAGVDAESELQEWRDRALRQQADMDNYRKRQRRLAQDEIRTERERLLRGFLPLVDHLEHALAEPAGDAGSLHQGVGLTHRAATQMLQKEGVEQFEANLHAFDPAWHEAVATVRSNGTSAELNTIVQVMEPGYRIGDRLLRPAKVVVAV